MGKALLRQGYGRAKLSFFRVTEGQALIVQRIEQETPKL